VTPSSPPHLPYPPSFRTPRDYISIFLSPSPTSPSSCPLSALRLFSFPPLRLAIDVDRGGVIEDPVEDVHGDDRFFEGLVLLGEAA